MDEPQLNRWTTWQIAGRRNGKTQRRQAEWVLKDPSDENTTSPPLPLGSLSPPPQHPLYRLLNPPANQVQSSPSKPQLGFRIWRTHSELAGHPTWMWWAPPLFPLIDDDRALQSLVFDNAWVKGTNTAVCQHDNLTYGSNSDDHDPDDHESPSVDCACGFWCYSTPVPFMPGTHQMYVVEPGRMLGAIMYWGHCIEHESGIRVQHAQVIALHKGRHTDDEVYAISERYDVPWFDNLDQMIDYARSVVDSSDQPMFDPASPPV